MKKLLVTLSLAGILVPSLAFAAPTGWKAAADCQVPPDHGVYDDYNKLSGCITEQAWAAAAFVSNDDQSKLRAFIFPSSTTKLGSNGVLYTCPWYFGFIDCILPPAAR